MGKIIEKMLYKLRGECVDDFVDFETTIRDRDSTYSKVDYVQEEPFPDFEVTFQSGLNLDQIRDALRLIPDGHVMLQTVACAEEYAGERDYDLM